jgi:hypothetical protein
VARLLADENMPLPVVEALRSHGHDVATLGALAGQRVSDAVVLAQACLERRAVLTMNRQDFFVCTVSNRITKGSSRAHSIPISTVRPDGFMRHCLRQLLCAALCCA